MKNVVLKCLCVGVFVLLFLQIFPPFYNYEKKIDESKQNVKYSSYGPYFTSYLSANSTALSPQVSPGYYDHLNLSFQVDRAVEYNLTIMGEKSLINSESNRFAVDVMGDTIYTIQGVSNGNYTVYNSTDGGQNWNYMFNSTFGLASAKMSSDYYAFAISPDQTYWYIGYIHNYWFGGTYDFYLIRSADQGKTWSEPKLINSSIRPTSNPRFSLDIAVSSTGDLYAMYIMSKEINEFINNGTVVIDLSTDNGDTWETVLFYHEIADNFQEANIAINPVNGHVVGMWAYNSFELGYLHSTDGMTFSQSKKNRTYGLWYYTYPTQLSDTYNSHDLRFDQSGRLFFAYLGDRSLRYAFSDDEGNNWFDGTDVILKGTDDLQPLALVAINLTAGLDRNKFFGNLTLLYLGENIYDILAVSYAKSITPLMRWNGSLPTAPYRLSAIWNGSDFAGQVLRDDEYSVIAQIVKPGSYTDMDINSDSLSITIDNTGPTLHIDLNNGLPVYLSPRSSQGIQDTVDFYFQPSERVAYELAISKQSGYNFTSSGLISTSTAYEHQPDLYVDSNGILYSVYASNIDGNFDIYFIKSTDHGNSWGFPQKIVGSSFNDYDPCVAVYGQNIYVAWSRIHNDNPESLAYLDLFFIKSKDGGSTWSTPGPLTSGFNMYDKKGGFFNPDMVINSQGKIFLTITNNSYNYPGYTQIGYYLFTSEDEGANFIKKCLWNQTYTDAVSGYWVNPYNPDYMTIGQNLGQMSLAIDTKDYLHVVYDDFLGYNDRMINYSVSIDGGLSFMNQTTLWRFDPNPSTNERYLDTSIAINKNYEILVGLIQITNTFFVNRGYWMNLTTFNPVMQSWANISPYKITEMSSSPIADNYGGSHLAIASGPNELGFEFALTYSNNSAQNFDIRFLNYQNRIWERTGIADESGKTVSFNGQDNWGGILPDGEYNVTLTIFDATQLSELHTLNLTIDNTNPVYISASSQLPDALAVPTQQNLVNITSIDPNLQDVYILKRNDTDGNWIRVNGTQMGGNLYQIVLEGFPNQKRISYRIYCKDKAGNELVIDNAGTEFIIYTPQISHKLVWGSGNQPTTYDDLDIWIKVSEGASIIHHILVTQYSGNDLREYQMNPSSLTEVGYQALYNLSLIQNYTAPMLNYNITCVFLNNKTQDLASLTIQSPDFTLDSEDVAYPKGLTDERIMDSAFRIALSKSSLDTRYIEHIEIWYLIQDDPTNIETNYSIAIMNQNETHYFYEFQGSQQIYNFKFDIVIVDVKNQSHLITSNTFTIIQPYVPEFPEFSPSETEALLLIFISAVVGMIFGIGFIKSNSDSKQEFHRNLERQLQSLTSPQNINATTEKNSVQTPKDTTFEVSKPVRVIQNHTYLLTTILSGCVLGFGVWTFMSESWFNAWVLFGVGILLTTLTFIQRVVFDAKNIIRAEQSKFFKDKLFTYIHVLAILVIILLFLISGNEIIWFSYYILQDVTFGIPTIYLSLIGVFITSGFIISISTFDEAKDANKNTKILRSKKGNWRVLLFHKEDSINKLTSRAGVKSIVFLLTLGFTIISTNQQLLRYANVGLLLLLPFIGVFALFLLISALVKKWRKPDQTIENLIVEKTKHCIHCNAEILFDSIYCDKCGQPNAGDNVAFRKVKACSNCSSYNPEESAFCRYCGTEIENGTKKI